MIELALNGMTDLPAGKIASVVTTLEMTAPPPESRVPDRPEFELVRVKKPGLGWYRDLYRRVGEELLWFSRQQLSDQGLRLILHDSAVEVYALRHNGRDEGLLELDRRIPGEVELAFFGLTPALVGTGAGRWLMTHAQRIAWGYRPRRFWVHTCTLDHPAALSFYVKSGFVPSKRSIEVVDDPRLDGTLPREAAPQVPVL